MPLAVRLHIFSGRPDPIVLLPERQGDSLLEGMDLSAKGTVGQPDPAGAPGLGYRGFSIQEMDGKAVEGEYLMEAFGESAASARRIFGEPEIERRLLQLAESQLEPEVAKVVRQSIGSSPDMLLEGVASVACPPCGGGTAPAYNPTYWNSNPRLSTNNCYNYANDHATNSFAQPGRGTGQIYMSLACTDVRAAASRDGLRYVPTFQASVPGWYVALVVWPGQDYHWYRQDQNGCWSHKPGQTPARNTDNSGQTIADPATCDRGPYTDFCCYMTTDRSVTIG
jgi:hypothetical protein